MAISAEFLTLPMREIVTRAWAERHDLDLTGAAYGRIHWGDQKEIATQPFPYYYFLAGLVRLSRAEKIIEVGTHFGGSSRAMALAAANPAATRIVTFDITSDGVEQIGDHPIIRPYQLDANSEAAFAAARHELGGAKADFVYIDTAHTFWPTLQSFSLFAEMFSPALVVLDDVTLNEEMSDVYKIICSHCGEENVIDASALFPEIRPSGEIAPGVMVTPGFAVVRFPGRG